MNSMSLEVMENNMYDVSLETIEFKIHKKAVKHGGASSIRGVCFTASGVGLLVKIEGIMNDEMYRHIRGNNLAVVYADNLGIFQQDNESKHCSKMVKSWFSQCLENANGLRRVSTLTLLRTCGELFSQKKTSK